MLTRHFIFNRNLKLLCTSHQKQSDTSALFAIIRRCLIGTMRLRTKIYRNIPDSPLAFEFLFPNSRLINIYIYFRLYIFESSFTLKFFIFSAVIISGYNLCHHNSVIIYFCNLLCDQFLLSFYMLRSNLIIFMLSFFVTIFRHLPFPSIFLHFVQDTTDIFLGHLWRFVYVQFPSFPPSFSVNFPTPGLAMVHRPLRLSHTKCL